MTYPGPNVLCILIKDGGSQVRQLQGLQLVEKDTYRVILLASHAPSSNASAKPVAIRYANDLDIASDGTVFFTDSQALGPVLNPDGFYDTLVACILGLLQVGHSKVQPTACCTIIAPAVSISAQVLCHKCHLPTQYTCMKQHVVQGGASGRLLAYDPRTKATRIVAEGLYYANGVALSQAGDYAAVVETGSFLVKRHWLSGPKVRQRWTTHLLP